MDRSADALIGRVLDGRYRVGPKIARGGMATVYEATDLRLDRTVAVKVMHEGLVDDEEFVSRFQREARAAARLAHHNVVAVFDTGDDNGTLFLVMEYVPGLTLRDLIRKEAPMSPAKALAMIEPVLSALAAAHDAGILHRDVKPENVLLADDGRVKVADFGLARAINSETQHTATGGVLIGTVSYLSPELVVNGKADARADVYAAGVLIYEMLTGHKPHQADSPIQVAYKHVHEDIPRSVGEHTRHPAVRRRAGRPRHRPRHRPASRRRPRPAPPGTPRPQRPRPRRRQRPRPAGRPDTHHADRWWPDAHRRAARPDHRAAGPRRARRVGRRRLRPGARRQRRTPAAGRPAPGIPPAHHLRRDGTPVAGKVMLIVVLLLALLAGLGGWYFGIARYTSTPSVLSLTEPAARVKLDHAGLDLKVEDQALLRDRQEGPRRLHRPRPRRPGAQERHRRRRHLARPRAPPGARRTQPDPRRRPAGARRREAGVRR